MILACQVDAITIVCINDPYDYTESIKDDEHELHIQRKGHIPNVFMKSDDQFPSAHKFRTILCSAGNKKRLLTLILQKFPSPSTRSCVTRLVRSVLASHLAMSKMI